ncbi:DUF2242 domain-containing protein [Paraburkholderia dinghuensis]|uniref:DUF2242 domain-containing protein n=2 Tax=Paraburkholderia dinghuensis TaxID=2305225 RepID=A0A3N6MNN2_9BURK|nr:DUF2242 domain-containing protein [Paraburkholderia dinghuensis]
MPRFPRIALYLLSPLVAAAVVAVSACSSTKPKFSDDQLLSSAPNQFSHNFAYASAEACEASRRALLSQGYMTTMTHNDTVDATKNFQPESDSHIVVEVHAVCTDGDASNTSVVYVNAVQNGYALKKSDTSASVGLSILGSVSLPIRSNSDSMVKISSETIQSKVFYERFFELVGRYLGTAARSEAVPDGGAIKITPLPPIVLPATAAVSTLAPQPLTVPGAATPVLAPVVPAAAAGVQPNVASTGVTASAAPVTTLTSPAVAHSASTAPAAISPESKATAAAPAAASSATVSSAAVSPAPAANASSAAPSATTPAAP